MDSNQIRNFPPNRDPNSINSLNNSSKEITNKKSESSSKPNINGKAPILGGIFNLPPDKVVSKLSNLLQKSLQDPNVEKLLTETKIPPSSEQALALCSYTCIKDLIGQKLKITNKDEQEIFEAIKKEFEENTSKITQNDDENKKEKRKRKQERKKKSNKNVNLIMNLIEETIKTLENKTEKNVNIEL